MSQSGIKRRKSLIRIFVTLAGLALFSGYLTLESIRVVDLKGMFDSRRMKIEKIRSVTTKGSPTAIAWSRDGTRIAAIHDYGRKISVWNENGELINSIDRAVTTGPYVGSSLAITPDGRFLVAPAPTPARDAVSSLGVWDLSTGALDQVTSPQPSPPTVAQAVLADIFSLSPDGSWVAVTPVFAQEPISIYRTSDWSLIEKKKLPLLETIGAGKHAWKPAIATALAFAANNSLAVGLPDGTFLVGSIQEATWSSINPPEPPTGFRSVSSLAYTPDGRFIAVGFRTNTSNDDKRSEHFAFAHMRILESVSENIIMKDDTIEDVRNLAWSGDGQILGVITESEILRIYRPTQGDAFYQEVSIAKGASTICFSPANSEFAVPTKAGMDFYSIK